MSVSISPLLQILVTDGPVSRVKEGGCQHGDSNICSYKDLGVSLASSDEARHYVGGFCPECP